MAMLFTTTNILYHLADQRNQLPKKQEETVETECIRAQIKTFNQLYNSSQLVDPGTSHLPVFHNEGIFYSHAGTSGLHKPLRHTLEMIRFHTVMDSAQLCKEVPSDIWWIVKCGIWIKGCIQVCNPLLHRFLHQNMQPLVPYVCWVIA